MKKICFYSLLLLGLTFLFLIQNLSAQNINQLSAGKTSKTGVGFRVGLNYAKVSGEGDSISYHYTPGLMIAVFLSPPTTGVVGYRSELLYSRQGFQYDNGKGTKGTVTNDYLMLPQMMTIKITKLVQLQAGAFAGYLLHTKDSNAPSQSSDNNDPSAMALSLMNRIDYGAAAGIEVHPLKGLTLSARYNMGFARLYKEQSDVAQNNMSYAFNPLGNIDTKNAVLQFSVGYIF